MEAAELAMRLHDEKCSCVIYNRGELRIYSQRGVKDLFELLKSEPERLHGAVIADKVVGKGASALMAEGGVDAVYADVISLPALNLLKASGIAVSYGECVENIINRAGTGVCPVETLCMECETAGECIPLIEEFIEKQKQLK